MIIRISIFDFLRIEHLTQVGDFSPSVDSGVSVDHYNAPIYIFRDLDPLVEFNALSKSGFGIEIGHFSAEIYSNIATFQKN
jgi:hypothetical protein